jgi:4-amino-4-deoxy-L-arabinose transferase-like glycosyltransferase
MVTPPRSRFQPLAFVVAVAVLLRLGVVVFHADRPLAGDELSYDAIAWNVASGHGYAGGDAETGYRPTAVRGPGYVLFLAGFYAVFGHRPIAPLVAQAFLDGVCVVLVHRLTRRWFRQPPVAILAAAAYAVNPLFIQSAASLWTETTTHLTLLATVAWFFAWLETRRPRDLVASALALGVCALSKPQLAPVGVVLCVAAWAQLGAAGVARATAIVVAVVTLVLAPWIARNALTFQRFIPGVSTGGLALWFGAGPIEGRTIGGLDAPGVPDSLRRHVEALGEIASNDWAAREAKRLIAADPAHYAWLGVKKFLRLWFNVGFDGVRPSRLSWIVAALNLATIALALLGARRGAPRPPAALFLLLLALAWTAVNLPFFTVVRYAYPYYALLLPFAAAGLVALVRPRLLAETPRAV